MSSGRKRQTATTTNDIAVDDAAATSMDKPAATSTVEVEVSVIQDLLKRIESIEAKLSSLSSRSSPERQVET